MVLSYTSLLHNCNLHSRKSIFQHSCPLNNKHFSAMNRPDPKTQKHWNLILCNRRIVHKGLPNGILNTVLSNPTTAHKGIHNLMRVAHRESDLIFIWDSSDELPSLTSSAPNRIYNKNLGKSLYKLCVLSFCSISGSNRKTHSAWDSSTRQIKKVHSTLQLQQACIPWKL